MTIDSDDPNAWNCLKPPHGDSVIEVQNPITRYTVRLDPPFVYSEQEQLDTFMEHFSLWCQAMWMIGRMSPEVFKAERGWTDANPYWQLARGIVPDTEA